MIYVYDIETGTSELVTRSYHDPLNACKGYNPSISHDGRYIAFHSDESGLVESDTNGKTDVFVYDRVNKTMQLASLSGSGEQAMVPVGLRPSVQMAASLPSSRGK